MWLVHACHLWAFVCGYIRGSQVSRVNLKPTCKLTPGHQPVPLCVRVKVTFCVWAYVFGLKWAGESTVWCVFVTPASEQTHRRKWHVCACSRISWSPLRWHAKRLIWTEFTCLALTGGTLTLWMHQQWSADFFWRSTGQLDTCRLWSWLIFTSALPFSQEKNQPALPQAVSVPLRCCAGAGGYLWTSPWLSTQWWPPPWPAVTAWAAGTAAWTTRVKTSLSSQPRPRSSVNPGRQLRYRIWTTLTVTDEIVRLRQVQIGQVAGVSVGLGNKLPFTLKHGSKKQKCVEEVVMHAQAGL